MKTTVEQEVRRAYSDCTNSNFEEAVKTRNLDFKASEPVSRTEASRIMGLAIPNGYNEFTTANLRHLPADSMIQIAREGSVCIYVAGKLDGKIATALNCDEFDYEPTTNQTRIWWD